MPGAAYIRCWCESMPPLPQNRMRQSIMKLLFYFGLGVVCSPYPSLTHIPTRLCSLSVCLPRASLISTLCSLSVTLSVSVSSVCLSVCLSTLCLCLCLSHCLSQSLCLLSSLSLTLSYCGAVRDYEYLAPTTASPPARILMTILYMPHMRLLCIDSTRGTILILHRPYHTSTVRVLPRAVRIFIGTVRYETRTPSGTKRSLWGGGE